MKKRLRLSLQIAVIAIVILSAVSLAGIAIAQSSPNFQFACWGLATGGGGNRASTSFQITDAVGQSTGIGNGAIAMVSPNFQIRPGYAQILPFQTSATITSASIQAPTVTTTDSITNGFYIPLLNTFVPTIFNCPTG